MADKRQDEDRAERDRERSEEAHWRVAEGGAEDEPKQKTPKGYEIPVPKRDEFFGDLEKVSKPKGEHPASS